MPAIFFILLFSVTLIAATAKASDELWHDWTSLEEPSQYRDHFPHYSYVNPHAPQGGIFNQSIIGSFNNLNPYILEGNTPGPGLLPFGGGLLYETLMEQSLEESGVSYGQIAAKIFIPKDHSFVRFQLNPQARWHDGKPINAEDVVWSFDILKEISPHYRSYYKDVEQAEIINSHEVKFSFKTTGNRELPHIMGDLVILPKHWWESSDKNGKKRNIRKPTLEIPLGSGPYKIIKFKPGNYVLWEKVTNHWGRHLPFNIGRYNFHRIKHSYFLDANAEWEAFKKGGTSDFRHENTIQRWVKGYDFPAFHREDVKKISFPTYSRVYQAYFFNTRRHKFSDRLTRQALTLAFNFPAVNRALYFNQYQRVTSYYGNQIVSARGLPKGAELALLETIRSQLPTELFTKIFTLPAYDTEDASRKTLQHAMNLLKQAGWRIKNQRLVDKNNHPFRIEFLLANPGMERVTSLYVANLKRLGIDATIRMIDSAQYENRKNNFDYDIVAVAMGQSSSPGNEQIDFFSSHFSDHKGTKNTAGIKNPAIDYLIDRLIHAKTRNDVVITAQAIDRVLLWNYYSVPHWYLPTTNIAYWKKLGIPDRQPQQIGADLYSWWVIPKP